MSRDQWRLVLIVGAALLAALVFGVLVSGAGERSFDHDIRCATEGC